MRVVAVEHDGPMFRHHVRKGAEGALDIRQVFEEVQVIFLHVQHDRDGRAEGQEGVAVFAGFCYDGVSMPDPVACT